MSRIAYVFAYCFEWLWDGKIGYVLNLWHIMCFSTIVFFTPFILKFISHPFALCCLLDDSTDLEEGLNISIFEI